MKQIQPLTPVRTKEGYGYWTHPDFFVPANGNEYGVPGEFEAWAKAQAVEVYTLSLDADPAADDIQAAYEAGEADVSAWNPTPPVGKGWFLASVHDTEDGPYSVWLRCTTEEQAEIARLKSDFLEKHQLAITAAYEYFKACPVGTERAIAHQIYQVLRTATRVG
ncbi:hypothetical protein [Ewingella americana]|uniref:hypothetical protein n=1 Tax=Ewingella americana TaxID=41202 RepID=UPI00163A92B8|nr:hypothetical protein [Ewingella americana]QMV54108.1 hypothetical protein GXP68_22885 [Ewingella americana]